MNRYYRTKSLKIASFLFSKNQELAGVHKIDNRTSEFVFVDSPECHVLVNSFDYSAEDDQNVLVDARKLLIAEKTLKEKIYRD